MVTAVAVTQSTYGEIRLKSLSTEIGEAELSIATDDRPAFLCEHSDKDVCAVCEFFHNSGSANPQAALDLKGGVTCSKTGAEFASCIMTPVSYQGSLIGMTLLASDRPACYSEPDAEACRWLARKIGYHAIRHTLNSLSTSRQGKDLLLVGLSEGLRQVDEFIEKSAQVNLPVLITGEPGSGKARVAYAIHYASVYREDSLLTLNCSEMTPPTFKSELYRLINKTSRGTIFFKGIDALDRQVQNQLTGVIDYGLKQWRAIKDKAPDRDFRIIASADHELSQMAEDGAFGSSLLWELNVLQAQIPPLRTRREDIIHMAEYLLNKYPVKKRRTISVEVMSLFEEYSWPGNIHEFESVIARLAAMTDGEDITIRDVNLHAPGLTHGSSGPNDGARRPDGARANPNRNNPQTATTGASLVAVLIEQDFKSIEHLHPSLQRALIFLARNFQDNMSVKHLAQEAFVSASHLSYLFQKTLDLSIKQLLASVRIEKAKRLLIDMPHVSIREISEQAGYGELRHFQRMFKRLAGASPREYRRLELEKWGKSHSQDAIGDSMGKSTAR